MCADSSTIMKWVVLLFHYLFLSTDMHSPGLLSLSFLSPPSPPLTLHLNYMYLLGVLFTSYFVIGLHTSRPQNQAEDITETIYRSLFTVLK